MISVCMATYNGEKYLNKQLDSILAQLGNGDEIIISDDSSTDNTISIIESYNDRRIILLKNNNFKSPAFNLENALSHAQGDYIFLSDQDDIWMENKVEINIREIAGYDVIVSDCTLIDENDLQTADSFYRINGSKMGFINNLIKNSYLGCCMLVTRSMLDYVLPFPKGIAMHDIWIGLNAEIVGKPRFISDKLIMYRRHGENMSPTSGRSNFSLYYKLLYRIKFMHYIILRILKKGRITRAEN